MKHYIKEDFKRAILSKNTLIAFVLCFICIVIGLSSTGMAYFQKNKNSISFFLLLQEGDMTILPILAPLIAAIPYSSSYVIDKKSGFIKSVYNRLSKKKYICSRLIVNAVVGGGVLAVSLLVALLISMIIYISFPITPPLEEFKKLGGAFCEIYNNYPVIYAFVMIWNYFLVGVIFSTIGFVASIFIENEYLVTIFPFLFAIIESALAIPLGLEKYLSIIYLTNPLFYNNSTIQGLILQQFSLIVITLMVFYIGMKRNED